MKMTINPNRPVEELIGDNRGICRQILGRIHCCTPYAEAYRLVHRKLKRTIRTIPVPLRRGLAKCVWDTLEEYRGTYYAVMGGRL
jgi:hypothetical protein